MFLKNKVNFLVLSTLLLNCSSTFSMDDSFEDLFDVSLPDEQEIESLRQTRDANCVNPQIILDQIININGPTLIQNSNIYLRTNGINVRSLLDLPILQPIFPDRCSEFCNGFHVQAFYNKIKKAFFTKNSPFLNSYIDLSQQDLVEELANAGFLNSSDFGRVLDLFQNIKLEQRRAGLMFSYQRTFPDDAYLRIFTPFYWAEANFFLNQNEIDAIKGDPFFTEFSTGQDDNAVRDFLKDFVSCDRVGFGDTRVEFAGKVIDSERTSAWLGFQATIPTAFPFVKGVLAGKCSTECKNPCFSLQQIGELVLCPEPNLPKAKNIVQNFLLGVLKRLTANVGNLQLGNGGHVGFGPQIDVWIEATDCLDLYTRFVYEFLMPAEEDRFFLLKKNPACFNRNYNDENLASENLAFLSQQIVNTLYPSIIGVHVRPGGILKFRQAAMVNSDYWRCTLGFDYWHQGKEHIKRFKGSECFEFDKAFKSSAYQGKIYGQYIYKVNGCSWHGYLGIGSDVTIFNRGIGKDFTIDIYLGLDF
ncbi:hypothetical protein M1446_03800 [Candidatus Dependentiae bacterium]|nr:hypothetical protein [Candidatus Dependentiae bacterium]